MPHVKDADRPPYDAFGLLRVSFEGSGGWGTACLIDERYLLTCAHNVFHQKHAARAASFYRAYNTAQVPDGEGAIVDCAFVKRAFYESHDRSWDIAVLRLTESIYKVRPVRLQVVTENERPETELAVAGYPGSHHYEMWENSELVTGFNVKEHVFAYAHRTEPGVSGAPLFRRYREDTGVFGVHSGLAENLEDKVGVLITETTEAFVRDALRFRHPAERFLVVLD